MIQSIANIRDLLNANHEEREAFLREHSKKSFNLLQEIKEANEKDREDQLLIATEHILDVYGIIMDRDILEDILKLSPEILANLNYYGIENDTLTREQVQNAVCEFFIGCDHPQYKDDVDFESFVSLLQSQAQRMGFLVKTES